VASFTDITELREARDELDLRVRERTAELDAANVALRESEERFRRLAENARDIIYRIRMAPTRGFEYVSPAATKITGYTPEEYYADPDLGFELVHPDDRSLLEALSHIGTAEIPPLVLRWVRKDGGIIWTEQRNVPIFDEAGELVALEGIARDITHRVQMATALRESEERFRHAFEYAPFGMALVGTDGRFLQVNASLCRSLGYGEHELLGKTFAELTFPDDLEVGLDLFEDLLAGRRDYGWLEKRYVRKDGHVIWTLVSTSMVRDSEGAPLYLVSQIQDITERKQDEEALWQQAQVIDQTHDSVIVTDLEGYVTSWNRGAERLTGYARAEALGRHISFLYAEDRQSFIQEEVIAPLQAKGAHEVEVAMRRKSGQALYAHLSLSLLRSAEGAVIGMIGYSMDITERKQAEQATLQYIRRLKILQRIDRAILSAQAPAEIAAAVLQRLRELLDLCSGANLVLFDLENQMGTVLATDAGRQTEFGPGKHLPLELAGDLQDLRQGKVYILDDVQAIPQPSPALPILQASGLRSYMCVPLVVQGELVGSLNLRSDLPGAFTPEGADVASEVAHSLAIAIQQARLFEQVRDSRERLQALSRRLVEVQEEERRRLTRELHDEIGQTLTAVKINLQTMQRLANGGVAAPRLEESIAVVERALQQVRSLALDLRPSLLDDLGLVATLRWYVDRQAQLAGFRARFLADPPEMHLVPELEVTCFRVAQEALTNVMRHAQAQEVEVRLRRQDGELELTVRDDGRGFDVQAALDSAVAGTSMGLLGMQERVLLASGQIDIVSAPGRGTEIQVRFPYSQQGEQ
jgi:PAS domain S-box-containing protein